ncbi:MAG TPA: VPDSG-CTERM sorting domain-containing protein [Verrucomicrobiae bacterium]|nr:VPDSG-CTERM sorting domain-containing protein [Verrucomicrobiae bacterium]
MRLLLPAGLMFCLAQAFAPSARALPVTATSSPGVVIPDNDLNGVADTINLSTTITSISDVTVTLDISGGYNGDYYAYLRHGATGFAVLLNRVGSTSGNPYGSSDSGLNVTFSDSAANGDSHLGSAGGGALTGAWQPDARNVNPLTALDTDPRTAFLSSFNGMDANGAWTLYIADVSPVGVGTLDSWSLTVDGNGAVGVPDGGATLGLLGMGLAGLIAFRPKLA